MRTVGGDAAAAWRMPNTGSMVVLTILTAVASVTASAPSGLYGLTMIHNSPVMTSFFSMDLLSGNVTLIGDPITQETGTGDLRAIDKKRSIYYFLGDTHAGATLVGIDMTSGSVACSSTVPLKEIGFVGMGQTLEMDTKRDRLVLAGIVTNSSGGYAHQILTAPLSSGIAAPADHGAAPADCAPFTKAGTFGIADYVPMLHSSAYDEDTQTLYVTVAPNKTAFALAVIDLGSKTLTGVDLEGSPPVDELQGMSWDPDSARVIGLMQNFESSATNANSLSRDTNGNGVNLMSLDPLTAKWTIRPLTNMGRPNWDVDGNEGDVHSYDPATGKFYALVSSGLPMTSPRYVAQIDWSSAAMLAATQINFPSINGTADRYKLINQMEFC